ncbi:hypothetical protein ACFQHN_29350 [Natrialbaceae archaeon GCM10025896]
MLVFAFDRDWTVDVNPRPDHEAVPLEWVRHLAHETEHAVYAIGNQELVEEAAIPGVVDIVGRHPDDWDQWLGEKGPDGYYERFPSRRERLALIADLHPAADDYVVVDDIDLDDVDGWHHYYAWDFVPAVKQGDIDSDLPWVEAPGTGSDLTTAAETASSERQSSSLDSDRTDPNTEESSNRTKRGPANPLIDRSMSALFQPELDGAFEMLDSRHRRLILLGLNRGIVETMDDVLSQDVFDGEADEVILIHNHLPKLAKGGYVRWDRSTGEISRGPNFGEIEPLLDLIDTHADELSPKLLQGD